MTCGYCGAPVVEVPFSAFGVVGGFHVAGSNGFQSYTMLNNVDNTPHNCIQTLLRRIEALETKLASK